MRVIVERRVQYHRPGTTLTFEVGPSAEPVLLPHDVRDYIVATGAGRLVSTEPGHKAGGLAALIARK
jgi:hypothetical protein